MINNGLRLQKLGMPGVSSGPPHHILVRCYMMLCIRIAHPGRVSHSVVSDSLRPQALYSTRLLSPLYGPLSECLINRMALSWIGGAQRCSPQAVSKSEPRLNITDKISEQEGLQLLNTQGGAVYQIKSVSHCDWDEHKWCCLWIWFKCGIFQKHTY